jgi:copper(I)-binding protein
MLSTLASAEDIEARSLKIGPIWTRATPPGADTAVGYLTVQNEGHTDDQLGRELINAQP